MECLSQTSNLEKIIDYEIMEGSLTFIYHFIELFKKDAKNVISKDFLWKWVQYLEDCNDPKQA